MSDIRMSVWKVLFDPKLGTSVVLLREETEERVLPIWIGQPEALSIAMATEKISLERPMTHDLLKSVIESLNQVVDWVRVHDLVDGTFHAIIRISGLNGTVDVDSRPSDAIALAVRTNSPIFVTERLIAEASKMNPGAQMDLENLDDDFLNDLPDELFGKYKM